jgi:hypothetical protein
MPRGRLPGVKIMSQTSLAVRTVGDRKRVWSYAQTRPQEAAGEGIFGLDYRPGLNQRVGLRIVIETSLRDGRGFAHRGRSHPTLQADEGISRSSRYGPPPKLRECAESRA